MQAEKRIMTVHKCATIRALAVQACGEKKLLSCSKQLPFQVQEAEYKFILLRAFLLYLEMTLEQKKEP